MTIPVVIQSVESVQVLQVASHTTVVAVAVETASHRESELLPSAARAEEFPVEPRQGGLIAPTDMDLAHEWRHCLVPNVPLLVLQKR